MTCGKIGIIYDNREFDGGEDIYMVVKGLNEYGVGVSKWLVYVYELVELSGQV